MRLRTTRPRAPNSNLRKLVCNILYYKRASGGALFYADEGEDFIAREPALGRQAVRGAIAEDFR